jgi:phosphatidate cytidylyltransferase
MILSIYLIIITYFILGGILFYIIYRNKPREIASQNRNKYISYFVIIHIMFISIVFKPPIFHYLALLIVLAGFFEIINLFRRSGYARKGFFSFSLFIFFVFSMGFICFSLMETGMILFTFLVVSIFDAFSQISGQLLGKHKLFPSVSPGKTHEGLVGGGIIAIFSAFLLKGLIGDIKIPLLLLSSGIVLFAFFGDAATSFYKRKYLVKDFSNLIPGHGGFLDRFDGLLAGTLFITLLDFLGI